MPTIEIGEEDKAWLDTQRKDTPEAERKKESYAKAVHRIFVEYVALKKKPEVPA